jgi:hypothetical protein
MAYVSGRVFAGQKTSLGTTAEALHPTQACREVLIQNDLANTTNLIIGSALAQYVALIPGQSITLPVVSLNLIYVKMSSGTGTVNWVARD